VDAALGADDVALGLVAEGAVEVGGEAALLLVTDRFVLLSHPRILRPAKTAQRASFFIFFSLLLVLVNNQRNATG